MDVRLTHRTRSGGAFCRARRLAAITACLSLAILVGHVVDRTTGQPLTGVDIAADGPGKARPARTNDAGAYTLSGLTPGHHTLTLSSDDVPPQTFEITVKDTKQQRFDITACSTTLDYSCAPR